MKRSPIKRVSAKRLEENKARATAMRWVMKRCGGLCEAAHLIATVDPVAASACTRKATDGHERRKRSRGGSISDPANIVACCRRCHTWTEDQPALAMQVGLLESQWS